MQFVSLTTHVEVSMSPFWQAYAQGLSDFMKVALILLAFIAVVLAVSGENKDRDARRITPTGYGTLITAILVAVCGIASWFADGKVKEVSDKKTSDAVVAQSRKDSEEFGKIEHALRLANSALTLALETQNKTLSIAMTQLPVEQVEVSIPRSEVQPSLPDELKNKSFAFRKPRGFGGKDDDFMLFQVLPMKSSKAVEPMGLSDSFRRGEQAWESFGSVYYHVCRVEISPATISEQELTERNKVGADEFYLTDMTLTENFLTFVYLPANFTAAQFDNNTVRVEMGKSVSVAFGEAKLPDTKPCVKANDFRIVLKTVQSTADTGLFHARWKEDYIESIAYSPIIKLQPTTASDQSHPPNHNR